MVIIFTYILVGTLFGLIAGSINEGKGYSYWTGFWCGFLLGLIGIVVVCVQTDKTKVNVKGAEEIEKYKKLLDNGSITKEEFEESKKRILSKL